MADTKFEVILGMFFLKISNTDMVFGERTLTWKSYITNKVLPTTKQVQVIDPKEFVIVVLDIDSKTFIIHVALREHKEMVIDLGNKAQIKAQNGAQVGALLFDKAPTEVPTKYSNYSNVFSAENATELLENTGINEHAIELKESKQPFFKPIYSLGPIEIKTLKTYIKTNLANSFIQPSKSPAGACILFNRKPDEVSTFAWIIGVLTI